MRSRAPRFLALPALCTVLLGLGGCASVTVHDARVAKSRQPTVAPTKIYVEPFTTRARDFRIDKNRAGRDRVVRETAGLLNRELVTQLNRNVAPAELATAGQRLPAGSWVLRGSFRRVNSGSATLRILVGLGAGGSKMETQAFLAQVGANGRPQRPFLRMRTTGGSGAQAGLISIPLGGPVGVPSLVYQVGSTIYGGATKGVGEDSARTARMIAAATSETMTRRGFAVKGKPLKPKRDWSSTLQGH